MAKEKLISVIISAYNEAKLIANCLDSLFNQSSQPDEVIVIDDGSVDGTVDKVKLLQKKYPSLQLIKQAHQGPGQARNLGAKKAKGKILVFVDADMEFDRDFIKILTAPIRSAKAKGAWSGNESVKNWNNVWARCWNYNQNRQSASMIGKNPGQRRVFRAILKSEFDQVQGFDISGYTDDWSLVDKLGYQPVNAPAKFYHHSPASLLEVFRQARWIGKRQYKLGRLGTLVAVFRANAAFSLVIGLVKAVRFRQLKFIIFKLIYDLGIMFGALESLTLNTKY
jgi:glycosyltransferase involved in cell wall biosynthesis